MIAMLRSNGPIRPMYVVIVIMTSPRVEKRPQRLKPPPSPTDRPTVPNAEATSKSVMVTLLLSVKRRVVVTAIMMIETMVVKRKALEISSMGSLLLKAVLSWRPNIVAHRATIITPKVVVLIPPPVLPGEAPITIRIISINRESLAMLPTLIVLKPAVLALTE